MSGNTAEQLAMQIFRDHLPLAAQVICDIAVNSDNERNQMQASKYIVERVMGRTPDARVDNGATDPLANIFTDVLREPTADERAQGSRVTRLSTSKE
jgi:hypothetical protein